MNRLTRFYNQNRKMFWLIILIIIAIIVLIQILNNFAYKKTDEIKNSDINGTKNTSTIDNNYAVITGNEIGNNQKEVIENFIDLCNNKQVENAYEMLSTECKEIMYPTLNDFKEKYYSRIFDEKKNYVCQAWITVRDSYTYRIDFINDMLATGTSSKTSIIDYYTVIKEDNEYKLNINKFIGVNNLDITTTENNVKINVKRRKRYIDYEIYDIEIENKTKDTIMLDNLQSSNKIYVEDRERKQYYWYSHEVIENDITIKRGFKKQIEIKFNKEYNINNEIVKIVFSNIVANNQTINISINI